MNRDVTASAIELMLKLWLSAQGGRQPIVAPAKSGVLTVPVCIPKLRKSTG